MKRRHFIQSTLTGTSMLAALAAMAISPKKVGIQLFSLPKMLEKNFGDSIRMLAQMGYQSLELYGPYPFSSPEAHASWNAITPMLGFSGSGYFGQSAEQLKNTLKENKMSVPSIHTDLITLQKNMSAVGEAAAQIGFEYAAIPSLPDHLRKTLDDYKRTADEFNRVGEAARKVGVKFAYHNHGYGLQELEGKIPLKLLLESTDPDLVFFEMDVFWTPAGGANPVEYLKTYGNRYHLMHLKDMREKRRFSGDGGDPKQWMELFPYMTTAGDGVLDLKAIITQAQKAGVKHYFVEQDLVADPPVALKRSITYLQKL